MLLKAIRPEQLESCRPILLSFAKRYGERRITNRALQWLGSAEPGDLEEAGTQILIACLDRRLAGISCAARYGEEAAFTVVCPRYRGIGLGRQLLAEQIRQLGRLSCTVACDNTSSLAMCFGAGMTAVELVRGPTGKPSLRFAGEQPGGPPASGAAASAPASRLQVMPSETLFLRTTSTSR